jgi:hypothetical protein
MWLIKSYSTEHLSVQKSGILRLTSVTDTHACTNVTGKLIGQFVKSAYQRSSKHQYLVTKGTNQCAKNTFHVKADSTPRTNNPHTFAIYGLILGYQKELQKTIEIPNPYYQDCQDMRS